MKSLRLVLALGAFALALPSVAHADALPPDACLDTDVGKACSNATDSADQPGTCVASKCNSPSRDGGSSQYDCTICEPTSSSSSSGGASSSSGGKTSSSSSGSSGSTSGDDDDDDGGCSTSSSHRDTFTGVGMLGLGLVAYAWSRRKQQSAR